MNLFLKSRGISGLLSSSRTFNLKPSITLTLFTSYTKVLKTYL
jgi:hypothetical protein